MPAQLPPADVLLDLLPDAVCVVDMDGRFVHVSAAFEALFGLRRDEVVGRSIEDLVHPDDLEATRHSVARVVAGEPVPNYRNRYRHRDGHYVHVQWSARYVPEYGVRVGVAHEVSHLHQREAALEHQALHDPLTGLPNRIHLQRELEARLDRAGSGGPPLALLYLDLDGFKEANDRYGHQAGDRLLVLFGERLRRQLRRGDFVARLGGDEFVVLLGDCAGPIQAQAVANAMEVVLAGCEDGPVRLEASIGIACHPQDGRSASALLQAADHRMYLTKAVRGRRRAGD